MIRKEFTDKELDIIREVYERGGDLHELERMLPHRKRNTLRNKSANIGCPCTYNTRTMFKAEEIEALRELSEKGGTWSEAFSLFPNRAPNVLRNICFRRKITFARSKHEYFEKKETLEILRQRHTTAEIAKMYHVSERHVSHVCSEYGLSSKREQEKEYTEVNYDNQLKALEAKEAALEACLTTAVANGTLAQTMLELNIVRKKIMHLAKDGENRYYATTY